MQLPSIEMSSPDRVPLLSTREWMKGGLQEAMIGDQRWPLVRATSQEVTGRNSSASFQTYVRALPPSPARVDHRFYLELVTLATAVVDLVAPAGSWSLVSSCLCDQLEESCDHKDRWINGGRKG